MSLRILEGKSAESKKRLLWKRAHIQALNESYVSVIFHSVRYPNVKWNFLHIPDLIDRRWIRIVKIVLWLSNLT